MPEVQGLLNGVQGLIPGSGLNGAEQGAISQLTANGQNGNPYAPQIGGLATNLLNGGGANAQAGNLNSAFQNYQAQTSPLASNTNYDPMTTPGIGGQLAALNNDITRQVNGSFAGAGRFGSGANGYALAQGLAAGEAPVLTNQYNQNVQNQQAAAHNLYGAGNTTAGALTGLNQQGLANQQQGVQTAGDALNAQNWGPQQILAAQQLGQSLPAQNLGLLANIGIPLAGLGSTSSGTGTAQNTMSGAQQLAMLMGSAGGFKGLQGIGQGAAGLGSALASGAGGLMSLLAL